MKLKDLYIQSSNKLKQSNIPTYGLDAKILLSHVLKIENNNLFNHFEMEIDKEFLEKFNILLERRLNREPVANIINRKDFWDYSFYVNDKVLTPRPDSETLIEAVLKNFTNRLEPLKIMELGVGSGCLILTLLKIFENSTGFGVDISDDVLKVAKINCENLNLKHRVEFKKNNWNDGVDEKFSLIISNPPYISEDELENLEPEVKIHNPKIALTYGKDGLDAYRYMAENIGKNMHKDTLLFLEIGKGQENDVIKMFEKNNFCVKDEYKDLNGIIRILLFGL